MTRLRMEALDGLRGVAAMAVLLFHIGGKQAPWLFPKGYLAVDFFFCLSGFVVALAYKRRLLDDMTFFYFVKVRLIRLYPLIAAGLLFGLVGYLKLYHGNVMVLLIVTGLLLIPSPFAPASEDYSAFALNPPSWSLAFEFFINVIYALFIVKISNFQRLLLLTLSAVAFSLVIGVFGSAKVGAYWPDFWTGFPRVLFSFTAGVVIHQLWERHADRIPQVSFLVLCLVEVTVLLIPDLGRINPAVDMASVLFVLPIIVILATRCEVKGRTARSCLIAGELSYPVYILQGGFVPHVRDLPTHLGWHGGTALALLSASSAIFIVFCYVVLKFYDEPIRQSLGRRRSAFERPAQSAP